MMEARSSCESDVVVDKGVPELVSLPPSVVPPPFPFPLALALALPLPLLLLKSMLMESLEPVPGPLLEPALFEPSFSPFVLESLSPMMMEGERSVGVPGVMDGEALGEALGLLPPLPPPPPPLLLLKEPVLSRPSTPPVVPSLSPPPVVGPPSSPSDPPVPVPVPAPALPVPSESLPLLSFASPLKSSPAPPSLSFKVSFSSKLFGNGPLEPSPPPPLPP
mmetsp:Transcript_9177/g.19813  ORF Transcript_9177/g.19813 Transcript_9177/m.19813 type:complete len:220 (-) Transcript_9177:570-1229(-)